jgi:hypothetical protein
MKALALLTAIMALACSALASPPTLEELWSHLFTNAVIVWQAPTNNLPKSFWVYQRALPHVFSATVISNAIVLAGFQRHGFPKPSTNDVCILDDPDCDNCGCMRVCNFSIRPNDATLSFYSPDQNHLTQNIPNDATVDRLARNSALKLGVNLAEVVGKPPTAHFNTDTNDNKLTNQICGRGIFLCRRLEGIDFFSANDDGDGSEGFVIEFGSYGLIRFFSLCWSEVARYKSQQTASPQEIIHCIRAHKTIVMPGVDEQDYFARLKTLASAKKLTIIKITPCYGEGVFGEVPTNDVPCKFVTPFAELEAIADFGSSNDTVRLLSPILSSEVSRLLGNKPK